MKTKTAATPVAVVALGGNSITREFEEGNIPEQFANTRRSLKGVLELIKSGYRIAITHGNGPQVGNALIRVEETRHMVIPLPLRIVVADLQGGMGYMIQQSLQNKLKREGIERDVCTLLTQAIVERDDPSMLHPCKYVGPYIRKEMVDHVVEQRGWIVREDSGRGYRRVVPSPAPIDIVEKDIIQHLVDRGTVVVCSGGGGIPVYIRNDGSLEGVDAVIDKDLTTSILARNLKARVLFSTTAVEKVALNYRKPNQVDLDHLTASEARRFMAEGHFPPGSMGPKVQGAIDFVEAGGERAVICSIEKLCAAITGRAGTEIVA
jgi:carbamate kinase